MQIFPELSWAVCAAASVLNFILININKTVKQLLRASWKSGKLFKGYFDRNVNTRASAFHFHWKQNQKADDQSCDCVLKTFNTKEANWSKTLRFTGASIKRCEVGRWLVYWPHTDLIQLGPAHSVNQIPASCGRQQKQLISPVQSYSSLLHHNMSIMGCFIYSLNNYANIPNDQMNPVVKTNK